MRMYILVREDVAVGHAMVAVAHASLAAYLKFRDAPEMDEWLSGPFFKVICKVNDKEFERAKEVADHVVITESALDYAEVAIAFRPRNFRVPNVPELETGDEYPDRFRFFRLYKG